MGLPAASKEGIALRFQESFERLQESFIPLLPLSPFILAQPYSRGHCLRGPIPESARASEIVWLYRGVQEMIIRILLRVIGCCRI